MKGDGLALLLLFAVFAYGSSAESATLPSSLPRSNLPPARTRRGRQRSNPFPPQPEPTDADLQVSPWDLAYPKYADLLWLEYARNPDRPGPQLGAEDLRAASGLRTLTAFERWALAPFFAPDAPELEQPVSVAAQQERYQRWWLASMAALLSDGALVQLDVGRKLYEQARDFYRAKDARK